MWFIWRNDRIASVRVIPDTVEVLWGGGGELRYLGGGGGRSPVEFFSDKARGGSPSNLIVKLLNEILGWKKALLNDFRLEGAPPE